MKLAKVSKGIVTFILITMISSTLALAQETSDDKKTNEPVRQPDGSYRSADYDEATRPDDSYLAKFHAIEVVNKLMKKNLDEIYMLKVIVTNFPGKGWENEYKTIYDKYKEAMNLYYKRNIIYARVKLEENQKQINELLKKIIDDYKKETEDLLSKCAEEVLKLHLGATTRTDPNKLDALHSNHSKLRIAYGQYDDAARSEIENYFTGAIFHLRVAKSYGIKILENLATSEEDRKKISESYKTHKADNMNRIYDTSKQGGQPADTQ